ncbi:hypothetical protein WG70_03585 [Burkholderia oklahomensis EO147]|nr:hypothetical protein WG70_03585 [Burkholderia oklahomensis EO147]KUY63304.1 hypothetical protein WG70_04460 [Burkholderia oklahomensis EO147]
MQALEDGDQARRRLMLGQHGRHGRQARDDGLTDLQADAEFEQKATHLVDGLRAVADQRFANPMQC